MTILVIGQERCGTHTLANMLAASGIETYHESQPTLCFEAYNRVVKNKINIENIIAKAKSLSGKAEANHRLQFFVDILANQLPDAKFIFLVRDPVKVISSLIGTMANWLNRTNLPYWYLQRASRHILPHKKEFNFYRIPPEDFCQPLAILHLRSWLRGLRVSLPLLESLGNRLKLLRTGKINQESRNLWNWLGLDYNSTVAIAASQQTDSMYETFGSENLASWANEQTISYAAQIYEEFDTVLKGFAIGREILSEIYHR